MVATVIRLYVAMLCVVMLCVAMLCVVIFIIVVGSEYCSIHDSIQPVTTDTDQKSGAHVQAILVTALVEKETAKNAPADPDADQ